MNQSPPPSAISTAVLMPHAPILVPGVGGERMHQADATISALRTAAGRIVAAAPHSVVLVSPHSPRRHDAFGIWRDSRLRGTFDQFAAPEIGIDLPNDPGLASAIATHAHASGLATWEITRQPLDHGALVPLWHLANAGWRGPTVVLSLAASPDDSLSKLGEAIAAAAQNLGHPVALVASGDMSHRLQPHAPAGYHPRASEFDRQVIEILRRGQYQDLLRIDPELRELAAEDVIDSTVIAAAATRWNAVGGKVLSYEGPFGVGYGVAVLCESPVPQSSVSPGCEELPGIARASIAAALAHDSAPAPVPHTAAQREPHAVFVTLRTRAGRLRGCVGTLQPRFPHVVSETWHLAREAAFHDSRFPRVTPAEFPDLRFEISVLQPLEDVASETDLDPQRYGICLATDDGRRGALLPALDGVDTVAEQLAITRRKAGIDPGEPVRIQRFTVAKFKDPDLIEHDS